MMRRASSVPRLFACPSSALPAEYPIEGDADLARVGTAVHVGIHEYLDRGAPITEGVVHEIASRFDVDADEVGRLMWAFRAAWKDLSQHFAHTSSEMRVESDLVGGTIDFAHFDGMTAAIGDWKSGYMQKDYQYQLASYAYAMRAQHGMPSSGYITTVVVWLRHRSYDTKRLDDAALDTFARRLRDKESRIGLEYNPGEHCGYCPRQAECPARREYVRNAASLVPSASTEMTPETLGALYPKAKMLRRALDEYDTMLRSALTRGPVPTPEGRLQFHTVSREHIHAHRAWPVLQACGFSDDGLAQCISMSKGAVMDVAGELAPPRQKGKFRAVVMDKLRDCGAVEEKIYKQIEEVKNG